MKSKDIYRENFYNKFCLHLKKFNNLKKGDKIIVAVSGGVDSVTLLRLLIKYNHFQLLVVHINHNIRKESAKEEVFVEKLCQNFSIPFYSLSLNPKTRKKKYSIEEWARNKRYKFFQKILKETNSDYIMTGHHGNDQAETILMNLSRQSGILGLRGIANIRVNCLRPMLRFTKKEILQYAKESNYIYINDISNMDCTIPRNFVRHNIIQPWENRDSNLISSISKSVDYIAQWQNGTDFLIQNYLISSLKKSKLFFQIPINIINSLPKIIKIRLIQLMIDSDSHQWSKHQINMLVQFIDKSKTGDFHILKNKWRLLRDRDFIKGFKRKNNTIYNNIEFLLGVPVVYDYYKYIISLVPNNNNNNNLESIDWSKLKDKKLEIRLWEEGDIFQPLGMVGHQKISDFLINEKVDRVTKESQCVITADGKIFWVCGRRISNWVKITNKTKQIASLSRVRIEG